jgi:hypothetical protein
VGAHLNVHQGENVLSRSLVWLLAGFSLDPVGQGPL